MMPSRIISVEVEVEVYYNHTHEPDLAHYESTWGQCQADVPPEVAIWAVEEALRIFDENPKRVIEGV